MARIGAAFLVALWTVCAPARAADSASHWKFENPFCGAVAAFEPLADGTRYAVAVGTAGGTTLEAHVTIIGQDEAYDVHFPDSNLSGALDDRRTDPVLVSLPQRDRIRYYFVDSYTVDRGTAVSCPSYVFPVSGRSGESAPDNAGTIAATPLQSLGSLACGQTFKEAETGGDIGSLIGNYGNRPLTTVYHVFIDSKGHAVDEKLVQSSGVEGVDSTALGSIQEHQYVPAQFLCTPVVGELEITMDYQP